MMQAEEGHRINPETCIVMQVFYETIMSAQKFKSLNPL